MADIKLFNIAGDVKEYEGGTVTLEKELQTVIEKTWKLSLVCGFLRRSIAPLTAEEWTASESTKTTALLFFEYKRSLNENVINQGLFYLNWLLDHKDSFKVLVIDKLGLKASDLIDWTMPRVLCIAGDFTKFDESAIKQMNRNISLIRYKKFSNDLLMFEQLNENIVAAIPDDVDVGPVKIKSTTKSFTEHYKDAKSQIAALYDDIRNYIASLGDDISENQLKLYVAFRKIKNFVCVEVYNNRIILHLRLDVGSIQYEEGFTRDTSKIGHYATGDVEITIHDKADFEKAKPLIDRAYSEN